MKYEMLRDRLSNIFTNQSTGNNHEGYTTQSGVQDTHSHETPYFVSDYLLDTLQYQV